jgi:hypothetical protein
MAKHHRWYSYYWAFVKQCGKECWHTWREEVLASAILFLCVYLINRSGVDFKTALLATAYMLSLFVLWHALRVPWILYQKLDEADHLKPVWGIVGVIFLGGAFTLLTYTAAWFFTMQPKVALTMIPDGRDQRITELETTNNLLRAKIPDETSLKVRSLEAADEYERFWRTQPKSPACNQTSTMTPEEQRKAIEPCNIWWNKRTADYQRLLAPRIMEIVAEFKAKGVDVLNIENCASMGFCGIPLSVQLRAFSLRLDAQDHLAH